MNLDKEINKLIKNVQEKYKVNGEIEKNYSDKIVRGHKCSMSTIIENEVTKFLCNILDDKYKYYIDFTINKRRPDLLIVNANTNQCELIVEIKANMGYCRTFDKSMVDNFVNERKIFKNSVKIKQNDENDNDIFIPISGNKDVKMMLVSFTKNNASQNKHDKIKNKLNKKDIGYYKLFDNWYNGLVESEIRNFVYDLEHVYGLKLK